MVINVEPIILAGLLGGLGGLTRGLVGLLKAMALRRKLLVGYFAITVIIAWIIGIFVGILFYNIDIRLSLLAGYAGTDILEGIYKLFKTKKMYIPKAK